jgi:chromate reductase
MFGAVWAQAELRKVLSAIGARVVDAELAVGQAERKREDGRLLDDELEAELREGLDTLVAAVRERALVAA